MRLNTLIIIVWTNLLAVFQLHAQTTVPADDDPFPILDYWPVIFLPIFGFVLYRWWKPKKRH